MSTMTLGDRVSNLCFRWVHQSNLVYNTCWEDPRLDRQALNLRPSDTLVMITSAGCNALDYALLGPRRIQCVDVNPRQNALLELKIAGIRTLDFDTFFRLFGQGRHRDATNIYQDALRSELSPRGRRFWDRKIGFFNGVGPRPSFYFRGSSGVLAWAINNYVDRIAKIRPAIDRLLDAQTLGEQRELYEALRHRFWKGFIRWAMGRDLTLSLLGVPRPQRQQIDRTYPGGVSQFVEDRVEAVFTKIPLADNYFWRVYLTGEYSPTCCPEYLKRENFEQLKAGAVDCIRTYTGTLLSFLQNYRGRIDRFVLLDHMDWLSTYQREVLRRQWEALFERASPDARILWRSGGLTVDFIDPLEVIINRKTHRLGDLLRYDRELADRLHAQDRVHTYGSFTIADLADSLSPLLGTGEFVAREN
jgi:S-adenosylmethionine-diacylglycerol 3-amino-3-carboxypropyl transferase